MEMQGQPMPAPQGAAPQEQGKESNAQTLIAAVPKVLGKIQEMIPTLGGSEEDAAAMDQIIQAYQTLMSKVMGGGDAEEQGEPPQAPQQVSSMGGAKGVPVGQ